MRERTLREIAADLDGVIRGADAPVTSVATDTRELRPGSLFVALRGARVDGHDLMDEAARAGAAGALVERSVEAPIPTVEVPDTGAALLELAARERDALATPLVAITGSVGKTSVKDLTAAVLGARFRVTASPRSFNTEVGVPLTILAADERTEAIVCEMGSRGIGHISLLCDVAKPDVGVVTAVGAAHLEMFGSLDVVRDAKAELPEALSEGGTAVLNADDPVVRGFVDRTRARPLLYGRSEGADVRAVELSLDPEGVPSFTLVAGGERERVELAVPGEHMASNALAAAACGIALGLSPAECAAALKDATVSPWRMERRITPEGVRVLNDAYNANPMSMAAALRSAVWMKGEGRCIAVLGAMAELGPTAAAEHERVGELVARLGVDRLVVVGDDARMIGIGAVREGVEPDRVRYCRDPEEAAATVRAEARAGDVVLVKGSRAAGLERVAERLWGDAP
ncbi:MAG TPA: UDP-N-acetylmuramoyl-tripeptide--D-alanyl-D-alanine ligase [Actinomycetota bacterium]|nr:UDP-N-acetylmuramoyl-tripeptide--D-alanyl-D-alanine ligase [Actinomycetota bacterium]